MTAPSRTYWPTAGWLATPPAEQEMDEQQLFRTDLHISDHLPNVSSLLVIRNGYLVFERYYDRGVRRAHGRRHPAPIEGYGYLWWIAREHDVAVCYAAGYSGQYKRLCVACSEASLFVFIIRPLPC